MKAYTDISQSKKLTEILPIESADMHYWKRTWIKDDYALSVRHSKKIQEGFETKGIEYIPCWSLTALLEQLDDSITDDDGNDWQLEIHKEDGQYYLNYRDRWGNEDDIETDYYYDLVDACFEMILKLHEEKLL